MGYDWWGPMLASGGEGGSELLALFILSQGHLHDNRLASGRVGIEKGSLRGARPGEPRNWVSG